MFLLWTKVLMQCLSKVMTFCIQADNIKAIGNIFMRKLSFIDLTHKWEIVHKDAMT